VTVFLSCWFLDDGNDFTHRQVSIKTLVLFAISLVSMVYWFWCRFFRQLMMVFQWAWLVFRRLVLMRVFWWRFFWWHDWFFDRFFDCIFSTICFFNSSVFQQQFVFFQCDYWQLFVYDFNKDYSFISMMIGRYIVYLFSCLLLCFVNFVRVSDN